MFKFNHNPIPVLTLLMLALTIAFTADGFSQPLDRIVAIVEAQNVTETKVKPHIITQSELNQAMAPVMARLRKSGARVDIAKVAKNSLDELVMTALRDQRAKQLSITVTDQDLMAMERTIEINNNLPRGSLYQALRNKGVDPVSYKEDLKGKMIQSRLMNRIIRPLVSVSEEEITDLFQKKTENKDGYFEFQIGQIMLEVNNTNPSYAINVRGPLAMELINRLNNGESLDALASQYSDGANRLNGGNMGWYTMDKLNPQVAKFIKDMEIGEVSELIRSHQGLHIFMLLDKRFVKTEKQFVIKYKLKAQHILLSAFSDSDNQEKLEEIKKIRAEFVEDKVSFATLAKKYSKDRTAQNGGELDWFSEGEIIPEFEKAAFELEVGEISQPVKSRFGWHLILVNEKEVLDPESLAARRKELEKQIMDAKMDKRYKQWQRDLRARAFVEIR
ncbi:MAG: peptidylprolyl isomerase [Magnetococcales bacterium]|nr:peptidylprolyl isomerase [Magnetococcales bacterium]